ncbi:hypothetical protein P154DRAFT_433462 [Amniculicola lignicola CBS 123094]|uniref:Uncharacterized protein n=1 Tax=Amniculicola lignicola CBS 123094 TaxID=1392246 RepID=A0A6A5WLX6_9PLEO|nr:hypothetical protein P154DRAFT_433462 [Amniculicola lignicola CBS 123094]
MAADKSIPDAHLRLAEILSDLTSLRVCDPKAALALVSIRPNSSAAQAQTDEEQDADIKRAKDVVELHYKVREAHKRGELGRGLEEARSLVQRAISG